MTRDDFSSLLRRTARRDRRTAIIVWLCIGAGLGFQSFGIVLGFMVSLVQGLYSLAQTIVVMLACWIPILIYMRKTRTLFNASLLTSTILRTIDRDEQGDRPQSDDPLDNAFSGILHIHFACLVHGTPGSGWKDGVDPYYSHPDDRRRRLLEVLTIAAWRDLPGISWQVRLDMLAVAQICIAAEVFQSRSLTGRIRNLWLRAFARRDPSDRTRHIVPVDTPLEEPSA